MTSQRCDANEQVQHPEAAGRTRNRTSDTNNTLFIVKSPYRSAVSGRQTGKDRSVSYQHIKHMTH